MVLDHGEICEFDAPDALLNDPESAFYALAADANVLKSRSEDSMLKVTEASSSSDSLVSANTTASAGSVSSSTDPSVHSPDANAD